MKAVVDMVFGPNAPGTDGAALDSAADGAERAGAGALRSVHADSPCASRGQQLACSAA